MRHAKIVLLFLCLLIAFYTEAQDRLTDSLLFEELKQKAVSMSEYNELLTVADGVDYQNVQISDKYCFGIQKKNIWYVVYSHFQNNQYDFQEFRQDSLASSPAKDFSDTTLILYHNALKTASAELMKVKDSLDFLWENEIIRKSDSLFEITFVPGFQLNAQLLYGFTITYTVNAYTQKIVAGKYNYSGLKSVWIGQPKSQWLNYREEENPEIGGVYFAWRYREFFTKVNIDLKNRTYFLQKDKAGNYFWTVKYK